MGLAVCTDCGYCVCKKPEKLIVAVECFGVYKNYDYNAHDSQCFFFVETKELANKAREILNEDDGGIAHCEGFEWCGNWRTKKTIAQPNEVLKTEDALIASINQEKEG